MECKSAITVNCTSTRASLRQLGADLSNYEADVQRKIQQLQLEVMQSKQLEESLMS